ncbi:MAG TPA: signal peptide peptidase SppA [Terriglobales bacterium]|nr:signal peptide peptidase SppA [Terriglobales bacterium]
MKKFILRLLAVIGALVVVYVVVIAVILVARRPHVPGKTILEVDLERPMLEYVPNDPFVQVMMKDRLAVRDVVDALDRAGDDSRVVGLIARVGSEQMGMAEVQEIREAVQRFRAKKKFAVAFAETFGEVGPGNKSYYLATAFDQIYLQPSGDIGLTGLMLESPFLSGTLQKLGMPFHGDHRYEYKSALNTFTEKKYTAAEREENSAILNSWFAQMQQGICDARHITQDQWQSLVDHGPYLGKEGLDAKLVDGLAYRDEVYDQIKKKAGEGAELLYLTKYLEAAGRPHQKGKTVALIYGVGSVQRGRSGFDTLTGGGSMGSDTVTAAFRAAIEDKDVKAILFRVDSPGGSYVASDAIWREVALARKAGKPVVVSMGDLAGSGGYFVAMDADKIVAQPGTITASIGVLGGKFLTSGFWKKVGLSWDQVHNGANATMWTSTMDYSPEEWARFEAWLDRVYGDFTTKAAEGRHMPKDKLLEIAKGRIWSGSDAKNLGLVDELGGFDEALALVKKAIGVSPAQDVKIELFPRKKSLLQTVLSSGPDNSEQEDASTRARVGILDTIQPFLKQLRALGIGENDVLRMPVANSE